MKRDDTNEKSKYKSHDSAFGSAASVGPVAYNSGRVGDGAKKFLNICGNEIEIDAAASSVDSNATNTRKVYRAALQTKYQHVRA